MNEASAEMLQALRWTAERWQRPHRDAMNAMDEEERLHSVGDGLLGFFDVLNDIDFRVANGEAPEGWESGAVRETAATLLGCFVGLIQEWETAQCSNDRIEDVPGKWIDARDVLRASQESDEAWLAGDAVAGFFKEAANVDPAGLEDYP